jgi:hypothetical protein
MISTKVIWIMLSVVCVIIVISDTTSKGKSTAIHHYLRPLLLRGVGNATISDGKLVRVRGPLLPPRPSTITVGYLVVIMLSPGEAALLPRSRPTSVVTARVKMEGDLTLVDSRV